MTIYTRANDGTRVARLNDHVRTQGGNFKGVCVSACLGYFGIEPTMYKFTWSKRRGNDSAKAIFRRFGYAVRSRKSAFIKGTKTVAAVRTAIAQYEDYTEDVMYYVQVSGHVLLINAQGQTVVDTDPRKVDRRRVLDVSAIFKNEI